MRRPIRITALGVVQGARIVTAEHMGRWVPARGEYHGLALIQRLRLAWGVFTGRYDALDWEYR